MCRNNFKLTCQIFVISSKVCHTVIFSHFSGPSKSKELEYCPEVLLLNFFSEIDHGVFCLLN